MQISSLLNEPVPSVRPSSFYQPRGSVSHPPQGGASSSVNGLSYGAPPQPGFFAQPRHLANEFEDEPLPTSEVLLSTSPEVIQSALQALRVAYDNFPDADQASADSAHAVTRAFNGYKAPYPPQNALWSDWVVFSTLCQSLRVPVFPIQPDKVALVLSAYAPSLPISFPLRQMSQFPMTPAPTVVERTMVALQVAANATRHLWPDVRCFIRGAEAYDATSILLEAVTPAPAPPQPSSHSGFHAPKSRPSLQKQREETPALVKGVTSRPMLTTVPSAPLTKSTDKAPRITKTAPPPESSVAALCEDLPAVLKKMQDEVGDPQVFDIAGVRFSETANSPAFAERVEALFNTATVYTHITAILSFPTYPITTLKLAIFALAMTPGPMGAKLDAVAPQLKEKRDVARASGKQLEGLMKDATVLRMITRGGDKQIPDGEKSEWLRWQEEVMRDWKGPEPARTKGKKRPSQTGRKGVKRSLSPTDSEASNSSNTRQRSAPAESSRGKGARQPRSRLHPTSKTEPSSRSSSRAGTPSVSSTGTGGGGTREKKGKNPWFGYYEPVEPVNYPRWVPDKVGKLPDDRHEPVLPPIIACPWWVPKKKKAPKVKKEDDAKAVEEGPLTLTLAGGAGTGPTEEDEEDAEEEKKRQEQMQRSIALHRPKRGGLDMRPFDVSLMWM
ncbi:hypothetical protein JCM6882_002604 [Rhodosporidiobolus microsporus]